MPPRVLVLAILLSACKSNPPVGLEERGMPVTIATVEALITSQNRELVDRVAEGGSASLSAPSGLRSQLGDIAIEALSRARVRARSLPHNERGVAMADLSSLSPDMVQFAWDTRRFNPAPLLGGQNSRVEKAEKGEALPKLNPGKQLYARVHAQIAPWPRDGSIELRPEILLAQAKIIWWSEHRAAQQFIDSLAVVLAERVAAEIERSAELEGLVARREAGRE